MSPTWNASTVSALSCIKWVIFPNEGLRGGLQFREIQENFRPALGFVNRTDVCEHDANLGYKHFFNDAGQGKWFQSLDTVIDAERIHEIGGGLQSASYRIQPLLLVTHANDRILLLWQ